MPDGLRPTGEVRFRASGAAAQRAMARVVAALQKQGLQGACLGAAEIVLAEIVNNIVEHAYAGAARGEVGIAFDLAPGGLWLRVWDRGAEFPGGVPPEGKPVDLAVPRGEMPEGGFGWHLIRSLVDEVTYERCDGVNRLGVRIAAGVCARIDTIEAPKED